MSGVSTRKLEKGLHDFEEKLKIVLQAQRKVNWQLSELEKENQQLKETNRELTEENKDLRKKYNHLQKDFNKSKKFAKIVTSKLTPSGGVSELRKSVEEYIQEIDKCIEILQGTL